MDSEKRGARFRENLGSDFLSRWQIPQDDFDLVLEQLIIVGLFNVLSLAFGGLV
jgi:hypothetical protein